MKHRSVGCDHKLRLSCCQLNSETGLSRINVQWSWCDSAKHRSVRCDQKFELLNWILKLDCQEWHVQRWWCDSHKGWLKSSPLIPHSGHGYLGARVASSSNHTTCMYTCPITLGIGEVLPMMTIYYDMTRSVAAGPAKTKFPGLWLWREIATSTMLAQLV